MRVIAMIPARLASVRVPRKNLREIAPGLTLLGCACDRALAAGCFDEVWVTTEADELADEAWKHKVRVHRRPEYLAGPNTNTEFKVEFLNRHDCDWCVNVSPTGPLVRPETIALFVDNLEEMTADIVHTIESRHGCYLCNGKPVNFERGMHRDTQDLPPLWHVTWALIGIRRRPYLGDPCVPCMWPANRTAFYELHSPETVDIDTEADLDYARYLYEREHPAALAG